MIHELIDEAIELQKRFPNLFEDDVIEHMEYVFECNFEQDEQMVIFAAYYGGKKAPALDLADFMGLLAT